MRIWPFQKKNRILRSKMLFFPKKKKERKKDTQKNLAQNLSCFKASKIIMDCVINNAAIMMICHYCLR